MSSSKFGSCSTSRLRPTHYNTSVFLLNLLLLISKKRRVKALLRSGGMPFIRILLLRVSGTLRTNPVTGGLKEVEMA